MTFNKFITSASDLVTTHEATRAGFLSIALEKNRVSDPYVKIALCFKTRVTGVILHSWLKYKEGFSADLVNTLLDEMNVPKNGTILDPFWGSGTTGLVCQMRGLNSIGFDIMPISSVSIKAKAAVMEYVRQEQRLHLLTTM